MQRFIPFPPYTAEALHTRFPHQPQVQRKLEMLQSHLLHGHTRKQVAQKYGISQARLSQVVTRWEDAGVRGLLSSHRTRIKSHWSYTGLCKLLRHVGKTSLIHLGALAEAQHLLPTLPDPLERGVWVDATVRIAIDERDRMLQQKYGVSGLLADYFLRGLAVKYMAQRESLSVSGAYDLIRKGSAAVLDHIVQSLPVTEAPFAWHAHRPASPLVGRDEARLRLYQALQRSCVVSVIGLPGMGKSTLVATCADEWYHYGWNILWLSRAQGERQPYESLVELHRQLARYGVLSTREPDSSRPWQDQIFTIIGGFRRMPILLVIDDCHEVLQRHNDSYMLQRLRAADLPLRIILSGLHSAHPVDTEIRLEGIDEDAAYEMYHAYTQQEPGGAQERARWKQIYASTHGNPKLIQLHASAPEDVAQTYRRDVIETILRRLPSECLTLAAWLNWWDEPVGHEPSWQKHLPATHQSLQLLQQYQIISLQQGRVMIHDLVRKHLPVVLGPERWSAIRTEVEHAAVAVQRWPLAFRCAQGQRDLTTQIGYARKAAEAAERHEQLQQARHWWEQYADLARQAADYQAHCHGLLSAVRIAIQLYQPEDAAQLLASTQPYDPATCWEHALYQAYCFRVRGDYKLAWTLQHSPPLSQPAPDEIQPQLLRLLTLERIITGLLAGQMTDEWQRFLALEPPTPGSDPVFYSMYHRIGAQIALNAYDYPTYLRLNRKFLAWSLRKGYRYFVLESRLEWARALYESERYHQANRQFQRIADTWEPHWHVLRVRHLIYCSMLKCEKGELDTAYALTQTCEQIALEQRLLSVQALAPLLRAQVLIAARAFKAAEQDLDTAYQRYLALADERQMAVTRLWQAQLLLQQDDPAAARTLLRDALRVIWQSRWQGLLMHVRPVWGRVVLALGDLVHAERHLRRTVQDARQNDLRYSSAEWTGYLIEALLMQRRYTEAFNLSLPILPLLESQPIGVLKLPRLAAVCAQSYQAAAQPQLARRAWHAALRHLRFQIRHLPPNADVEHFLAQPIHAQILAAAHGREPG